MLEESVIISDHRHERVTMQTLPGSPIEVVLLSAAGEPARKSIVLDGAAKTHTGRDGTIDFPRQPIYPGLPAV